MTTHNKTLAVDVLAVMARDATAAWNDRRGDREIQEFLGEESNEARAAVAELIEAVGLLSDSANPEIAGWSEAVTALARVKGESA
ncbi:TPA: hypothetical protein UN036_000079 [Stenotrophomonas maltophilia]|uniref:hypothetical protein n=1 Tax=Stenotrophomonas maltophilia TaxID=40324 RepID=UPI0028787FC2|nr:hypothetical protein [Stenotrophomonas maltophilia]MDT3473911.1 hypothetical protein [Stenotrophomonas maltophilia]HDX0788018.1 hypothetical protein [Stenotrophomonas maltophilia]HDX0806482.1 hypothetical protein [Stenotrophomonas maltophilia]HDX0820124.1 hypothetical protein [Stenotrophomonas maltophilia]HDX0833894.1 hypothetical protein [Stenotrophomonas maltophilia]